MVYTQNEEGRCMGVDRGGIQHTTLSESVGEQILNEDPEGHTTEGDEAVGLDVSLNFEGIFEGL